MNKTENKAKNWLVKEKGLKPGEIRKARGSPDFETPLGGFEVKRLYGDAIVFSTVQVEELRLKPETTILVFDHGDSPVAIIPLGDMDFTAHFWDDIRIICDTTRTIKLEDSVYTRLETFRGKSETFSQAVDRLLDMLEKVGELRDVLEGAVAFEKGKRERLERQAEKEE